MSDKIPPATIDLLSNVFDRYYTHNGIEGLFLTSSAPTEIPQANKKEKVIIWLRAVNAKCESPLEVLGSIISNFMDGRHYNAGSNFTANFTDDKFADEREDARNKILETLAEDGLSYSRGGHIGVGGASPTGASPTTASLMKNVEKYGLLAVDAEINRALRNVEDDPMAAVHNAGSTLESALKTYLEHYGIPFKEDNDNLSDLWNDVVKHIGISPKEMDNKDLKKIASGLYSIVDGTMHLRNKKSASHGKTDRQLQKIQIRPRHARLAIHAAHTISAYVLENMNKK